MTKLPIELRLEVLAERLRTIVRVGTPTVESDSLFLLELADEALEELRRLRAELERSELELARR